MTKSYTYTFTINYQRLIGQKLSKKMNIWCRIAPCVGSTEFSICQLPISLLAVKRTDQIKIWWLQSIRLRTWTRAKMIPLTKVSYMSKDKRLWTPRSRQRTHFCSLQKLKCQIWTQQKVKTQITRNLSNPKRPRKKEQKTKGGKRDFTLYWRKVLNISHKESRMTSCPSLICAMNVSFQRLRKTKMTCNLWSKVSHRT